jgi:glycosyltransferase involved in cell wall biosynthesis
MPNLPPSPAGPLVAVVTPVYNGAKHVEAAIRAVQAQTYRPLVHCIVDNASTDATPEIIARYAQAKVPVITIRNPETVTFQENSNRAVGLAPPEAKYFRILHADDEMPPTAIADMIELATQDENIVLVAGAERMNGVDRPHHFPPECSIYEASNMLARILSDEAHIPTAHVLVRSDAIRPGEDWYPTDIVECYIATAWRTLSRGKRAAFVHRYNGETRRYAGSGSLIDTVGRIGDGHLLALLDGVRHRARRIVVVGGARPHRLVRNQPRLPVGRRGRKRRLDHSVGARRIDGGLLLRESGRGAQPDGQNRNGDDFHDAPPDQRLRPGAAISPPRA